MRAVRSLSDMAQALLKIEGVDLFAMPRYMDIQVRVPLDPARDARAAAASTVEQILSRVQEVRQHEQALKPGAVYCYRENSAEAASSRPTEPRQVFDGYSSTGRPNFTDFVTMAIERKDPGIDALLSGDDTILTHVTMGKVLRTAQLVEFGQDSPVFRILGQVDAGLFRVLNMDQKAAFSIQLLLGKTLEGKPHLRLHPVGKADIMDLVDPSVALTLSRFQRRLDTESLRLAGQKTRGEVDEEQFVLPLLQDLAKQLSGRARREGRRTQHATHRSEEGQRPTTKAYADAAEVADENLLWDDSQNTAVVLGPRGRVHVFSPDVRHVTSVMMQGSAVFRRRQQHRWRPAEPEERGEFRIRLRQRMQSGDTPLQEEAPVPAAPPVTEKVIVPEAPPQPEPKPEPKPEAKSEAEPEPKSEAEPVKKVLPPPVAKQKAEPVAEPEPKAEPTVELEPKAEPEQKEREGAEEEPHQERSEPDAESPGPRPPEATASRGGGEQAGGNDKVDSSS